MAIYEVVFSVSSKDKFPADIKGYGLSHISETRGEITTKNIEADDSSAATRKAEGELRALLGRIGLDTGILLEYRGGRRITLIDVDGNRIPKGVWSDSIQVRVFAPDGIDSKISYEEIGKDPKVQRALGYYYSALSLNDQQNTPQAFLAMALALTTLVDENNLNDAQKKYWSIRHSIAHSQVNHKETREFFLNEFGTEEPNWALTDMRAKLLAWYNGLEGETTQLLRERLK